jgi:hypothetical protein
MRSARRETQTRLAGSIQDGQLMSKREDFQVHRGA